MRLVGEDWLAKHWWTFLVPFVPAIWGAVTGDTRLYIVAAILLFLCIPLFLARIYYLYSLTPEAIASVRPHCTVRNTDGSVTLHFRPDADAGREYSPLTVRPSDINLIEERYGLKVFHLNGKPFRYITIPIEI